MIESEIQSMRLQAVLLTVSAFCFLSCQSDVFFSSVESHQTPDSAAQTETSIYKKREPVIKLSSEREQREQREQRAEPLLEKSLTPSSEYREYIVTLKSQKKRMLDIVIVVDSSISMNHYLLKLGERLSSLLVSIEDYDWQVAFITADHGDHASIITDGKSYTQDKWQDHINDPLPSFGQLMPLEAKPAVVINQRTLSTVIEAKMLDQRNLNSQTPDYQNVFLYTVSHFPQKYCKSPPYCQRHLEQPLRALKSSIERVNYDNKAFFRPGADFVSLTITNEDERWEDQERATTAKDVVETFNEYLKPLGKRFFAFNILIKDEPANGQSCLKENLKKHKSAKIGNRVGELADQTGGFNISICDGDYSEGLQDISKAIETFVEQSVDIEEPFQPDTLQVEFLDSEPIPWKLSGNRLIFERQPVEDVHIKISYRVSDSSVL